MMRFSYSIFTFFLLAHLKAFAVQDEVMIFTHVESSWGKNAESIRPGVRRALNWAQKKRMKNFFALTPFFNGDVGSFIQVGDKEKPLLDHFQACEPLTGNQSIKGLNRCVEGYLPKEMGLDTYFWLSQGGRVIDPLDNYYFKKNTQHIESKKPQTSSQIPSFNFQREIVKWKVGKKTWPMPLAKKYYLGGGYLTECFCHMTHSILETFLLVPRLVGNRFQLNLMVDAIYTSDLVDFMKSPQKEDVEDITLEQLEKKSGFKKAFENFFIGTSGNGFSCLGDDSWSEKIKRRKRKLYLELRYRDKEKKCFLLDKTTQKNPSFVQKSCHLLENGQKNLVVQINLLSSKNLF